MTFDAKIGKKSWETLIRQRGLAIPIKAWSSGESSSILFI
jgi:hypothetical protein